MKVFTGNVRYAVFTARGRRIARFAYSRGGASHLLHMLARPYAFGGN